MGTTLSPPFDPFKDDLSFLIAAYVYEDVGVTAYTVRCTLSWLKVKVLRRFPWRVQGDLPIGPACQASWVPTWTPGKGFFVSMWPFYSATVWY